MRSSRHCRFTVKTAAAGCVSVALLFVTSDSVTTQRGPTRAAPAARDLGSVFEPGLFLRDTNDDGVVDAIDARIVLPSSPTSEEIAAASNVAARLGFESTGFTPGLAALDTDVTPGANTPPLILLGSKNRLVQQLVTNHKVDWGTLAPGQGAIAFVPSAFGGPDALVLVAADASGMLAVGDAASARLPYMWQLRGDSIKSVKADIEKALEERGVHPASLSVPLAIYQTGTNRIARLRVDVDVAAPRERETAVATLRHFADAHVVGKADFAGGAADRLSYYDIDRVEVAVGGGNAVEIPRFGPPYRNGYPASPSHPEPRDLNLATIYTKDGLLADERGHDMIPDQTATEIILGSDAGAAIETVDLAARIGMESTGVSLPLVKTETTIKDPSTVPNPILVGNGPLLRAVRPQADAPGAGSVTVVPKAFGTFSAIAVSGGDAAGLNSALSYLAEHVPYLWSVKRGDPDYTQVTDEVQQFFKGRSSAGQAALATVELSDVLDGIGATPLDSIDVKAYLEQDNPAFATYLQNLVKTRTHAATVTASAPSRYGPVQVFKESPDLGWEVDELRQRFKDDVLPKVKAGDHVQLEIEVSESPELRKTIEQELTAALRQAGAADATVRVICAYKQGYSWLTDYVMPILKAKSVASIAIKFPTATTRFDHHEYGLPIRWLQELFPVDDIFARELHIPLDATTFEKVDSGPITYHVEAKDASGKVIYTDDFSPRYEGRDYFYGRPVATIQYTTGGILAKINGNTIADIHVRTDPERFWDYYQKTLMPRMFDYVKGYTGGDLSARNQPFFRDLIFDITMSEPDFPLKLDEERISSMDSLNEDLMFDTIDFWSIFSGQRPGSRNVAPGRIVPLLHDGEGKPPHVTVTFNANAVPRPRLDVAWKTASGETQSRSIEIGDLGVTPPRVVAADVRAKAEDVAGLTVAVSAKTYAGAERAARIVNAFGELQAAGVLTGSLNYAGLDRLSLVSRFGDHQLAADLLPHGTDREGRQGAFKMIATPASQRIVNWDHPIFPDELENDLIPRLAAFPEVNAYVVGHTYRGLNSWAMDVMLPTTSTLWSQAKASTTKPVLFITTRQHSNELSATSATMRLVELLARDPEYTKYLKRMNIVYNPMENPDGAANDEVYWKLNPLFLNHSGYWSAVSRDVGSYVSDPDPLLPEALVRNKIFDTWLPDDYMNTHGYPTHEWVHQFAGYKVPWFLLFWIPRGYHINLAHMHDDNYPDADAVGLELRDRIIQEVQGNPEIKATNARLIHRYDKYARRYMPDPFRLELYKGMNILFDYSYSFEDGPPFSPNIYVNPMWRRPNPTGNSFLERYPQITVLDLGCDMPDEGASAQWMQHMAAPGQLGYLMANLKLIANSHYEVKRYEEDFRDTVHLSIFRPRPIKASSPSALAEAAASATDR